MEQSSSIVLGQTPIKSKSRRSVRELFPRTPIQHTPSPSAMTTAAATADTVVTYETRVGTIVMHKTMEGELRSGNIGVVTGKTQGPSTTLNVLWTQDGSTTAVSPELLQKHGYSSPSATTANTARTSPAIIYSRNNSKSAASQFYSQHGAIGKSENFFHDVLHIFYFGIKFRNRKRLYRGVFVYI